MVNLLGFDDFHLFHDLYTRVFVGIFLLDKSNGAKRTYILEGVPSPNIVK